MARSPVEHTRESKPSLRSTMPSISESAASSSTTSTRPRPLTAPGTGSVFATFASPSATVPLTVPPSPSRAAGPSGSVAVVLRLVGTGHVHAEVLRLRVAELGERDAERLQVQPGDLLVEVLGQ